MLETIRYAFGQRSAYGHFLAASSDRGLVAFEFTDRGAAILDTLRDRFPAASLEDDQEGLAEIVGKLEALADHPETDPGVALDPRGSDYQNSGCGLC